MKTLLLLFLINTAYAKSKNRVFITMGYGPTSDIRVRPIEGDRISDVQNGSVVGLGYQRNVIDKVNIGILIQNNKTTSLSVGLDF